MITSDGINELIDDFSYDEHSGVLRWKARDGDSPVVKRFNTLRAGKIAGGKNKINSYVELHYKGSTVRAHRVIWGIVHGVIPGEIDHINGDPSDNRLINLREVSHKVNGMNQKTPSNNTSGAIGVYWHKQSSKWLAYIKVNYKKINLGSYSDKLDAISARNKAEIEYGFHENHGRA